MVKPAVALFCAKGFRRARGQLFRDEKLKCMRRPVANFRAARTLRASVASVFLLCANFWLLLNKRK
jgi:hypothetical protein